MNKRAQINVESAGELNGVLADVGWVSLDASAVHLSVFFGSHGVAIHDVSSLNVDAAQNEFRLFGSDLAIGATVAKHFGFGYQSVDCRLEVPTRDICKEPAMDTGECELWIEFGKQYCRGLRNYRVLAAGEFGVANTTVAAAMASVLLGRGPDIAIVGKGSGISDAQLGRKVSVVRDAVKANQDCGKSPFELLRSLGGREIAALVGWMLAAEEHGQTIVLDGLVTCVAAVIANQMSPGLVKHLRAVCMTAEPAQPRICELLGLGPFIQLNHTCGQGLGAVLGVAIGQRLGLATMANEPAVHGDSQLNMRLVDQARQMIDV